jgi:hypothetical protein
MGLHGDRQVPITPTPGAPSPDMATEKFREQPFPHPLGTRRMLALETRLGYRTAALWELPINPHLSPPPLPGVIRHPDHGHRGLCDIFPVTLLPDPLQLFRLPWPPGTGHGSHQGLLSLWLECPGQPPPHSCLLTCVCRHHLLQEAFLGCTCSFFPSLCFSSL